MALFNRTYKQGMGAYGEQAVFANRCVLLFVRRAGELPTPRAHSKGGFVGDVLYIFGGCHSFHVPGMHHAVSPEFLFHNSLKEASFVS